jgi:hypothetical protein
MQEFFPITGRQKMQAIQAPWRASSATRCECFRFQIEQEMCLAGITSTGGCWSLLFVAGCDWWTESFAALPAESQAITFAMDTSLDAISAASRAYFRAVSFTHWHAPQHDHFNHHAGDPTLRMHAPSID